MLLSQALLDVAQFIVVCGSLAVTFPPWVQCLVELFVPFTGMLPVAGSFVDGLRCVQMCSAC